MFLFILAVLFLIAAFVCAIVAFVAKDPETKAGSGIIAGIGALIGVVLMIFTSYTPVDAGKVGIEYGPSGSIVGQKDSGGFIAPWDSVKEVDTKIQSVEYDNLNVYSKDTIAASMDVSLNYHINEKDVQQLIRTVGTGYEKTLIASRVFNDAKDATVIHPAIDLAPSREAIRKYMVQALQRELGSHGIQVDSVQVKNIDLPSEYLAAIQARQSAVVNAQAAQNKVQQIKAEAAQRVAQARGTADANVVEAEGQAKANAAIAKSISANPDYIQYLRAQAMIELAKNPNTKVIPSNTFFTTPTP